MRKKVTKLLHKLHRYFGLTAALFVVVLTVTGILLNHTESLRLKDRHLTQSWLLKLYGVDSPLPGAAYRAEGHWISQMGDGLFVDRRLTRSIPDGALKGAAGFQGMVLAALANRLLLLTVKGELVDELTVSGVGALWRGGDGRLVVKAADGWYAINEDFTEVSPALSPPRDSRPVEAKTLPGALAQAIAVGWRGQGLPVERVLLDLHSGRIFGAFGVWLMDGAALLLLSLTLTGLATWFGRRQRQKRKHRRTMR